MKTEKQECSKNKGFGVGRSVRSYSSKPLTLELNNKSIKKSVVLTKI